MAKRYANYRLIKTHRTYTVEEAAEMLGLHENTVRTWISNGLPVCDEGRPVLILGRELGEFLKARRAKNKQSCKTGELYCFRCRLPKMPAGAKADCLFVSRNIRQLQAICPDCFCIMNQRVSAAKLDQFLAIIAITFGQDQEQVGNTTTPSVNSDFRGGA